jgi:hypothetical protein
MACILLEEKKNWGWQLLKLCCTAHAALRSTPQPQYSFVSYAIPLFIVRLYGVLAAIRQPLGFGATIRLTTL